MSILFLLASVAVPSSPIAQSEPRIVEYRPGAVNCEGAIVSPAFTTDPLPTGIPYAFSAPPVMTVTFAIAADGRPISIAEPKLAPSPATYVPMDDLGPAVAAWRFSAGRERKGCSVTFSPLTVPVETAPLETLYRFLALPRLGWPGFEEAKKRAADTACYKPQAAVPLLMAFPDLDKIPQPLSSTSWTMVGYDLDRAGKPARVRTLASDGNQALDRAGTAAVRKSRFVAQPARAGCTMSFVRHQRKPVAPPEMPAREAHPSSAACEALGRLEITQPMGFPEAFRRRGIEGWAIVRYDVAPWGATGNLRVLQAEPAAQFGEQALRIIGQAKRSTSGAGASGCVERVRFKLPETM